tara:strand:- start:688 stop:951 length:264 start_codon:yes stop_codon:yes gene_type:complete
MSDKDTWKNEIEIAHRQLRRCKWYQFLKKQELRAYIDIIKKMYGLDNNCKQCGSKLGIYCGDAEPDYNEEFCSEGCYTIHNHYEYKG